MSLPTDLCIRRSDRSHSRRTIRKLRHSPWSLRWRPAVPCVDLVPFLTALFLQSQAKVAGGLVFLSGQIPAVPSTGELVTGSIGEKTAACCRGLQGVLEAAGSSFDKVVKVSVFLADMGDFAEMNAEYEKWFTSKPARTCVAVKTLPKGVDVEIDCIALA